MLRADADENVPDEARVDPEIVLDDRESTDEVLELIGTLPESEAEVVLLRVVADLDVRSVAEIVGKRTGTVRVLSHRGVERLRGALAGPPPVEATVVPWP